MQTFLRWLALLVVAWIGSSLPNTPARAAKSTSIQLTQILPRYTIYNYSAYPCPNNYIPDGPARAFKRADGKFVLMAEEAENWELVGTNPFDLRVSCPSILSSNAYGETVRGITGILATYTKDGQTIYGVAGQDLSPINEANGCTDKGTGNCWLNDLTGVISKDQGQTFNFTSTYNGDIAALTHTLSTTMPGQDGFFSASNIVLRNGYYYMLTYANDAYSKQAYNCLMRTSNLADPSSWRGYDGSNFTVSMQPSSTTQQIPCAAVGASSLSSAITSLSYVPRKKLYVAVFQNTLQLAGDSQGVPGAYYATSPDLVTWSTPQRIMAFPPQNPTATQTEVDDYPVLIDPFSRTRNFETIDSLTPVLVFTNTQVVNGGLTLNRNLVAIPFFMN